jgi:uncharacterized protein YjbI with pentapeptide repeats
MNTQDSITRIRKLQEQGRLTPEEAGALLSSIAARATAKPGRQVPPPGQGLAPEPESVDHASPEQTARPVEPSRGHRGKHRHRRQSHLHEDIYQEVGETIAAVIHDTFDGFLGLKTHRKRGDQGWLDPGNLLRVSHVERPQGEDWQFLDNQLTASNIKALALYHSTFVDNRLSGASITQTEIRHGNFSDNILNGGSLSKIQLHDSGIHEVVLNGTACANLKAFESSISESHWNGAQVKNVEVRQSTICALQLNGSGVRDSEFAGGTVIDDVRLNGTTWRQASFHDSQLNGVVFRGQDTTDWQCHASVLEDVQFRRHDGDRLLFEKVVFRGFTGRDLQFVNCRFHNCRFEDFSAEGLRFQDVDFSDQVITTADELKQLATGGDRD